MKNIYQKTFNDTLINSIARVLLIPQPFLLIPLLTNNLSLNEYGLWGLIFTTCSLISPFTSLGLGTSMSRFVSSDRSKENMSDGFFTVLITRMFITLILVLFFFLFRSQIAYYFFESREEIINLTAIFIIVLTIEPIFIRLLRIIREIKVISIIQLIDGYGTLFAYFVILTLFNGDLIDIAVSLLVYKILLIIYLSFYFRKKLLFKKLNLILLKKYLKFGLPTLPSSLSFWFVNLSDRYIISFFVGAGLLGAYTASYTIGSIPRMISAILNFILLIAISELYEKGLFDQVKNHLKYALKYFLAFTIPYIFANFYMSYDVLVILTTNEIANLSGLIPFIVSIAYLFLGIYAVFSNCLLVTKKTNKIAFAWFLSLPVNIVFNIIFIPKIGIIAAAYSTLISYFISMIYIIYFGYKEFSFDVDWGFVVKSFISSFFMTLFIINFKSESTSFVIFKIIISIFIYLAVIFVLKGFSKKEVNLLLSVIGKKI